MKNVIIIPARLESTRLPKKVLLEINGKSIIQRVFENCKKIRNSDVYIATDNILIKEHCSSFTNNIIITSNKHQSGTDRIAEAAINIECENIINVQGDEPFLNSKLIVDIFKELNENSTSVVSAIEKIDNFEDLKNPNNVKVTLNYQNQALYFSRSIIPYDREQKNINQSEKEYFNQASYFKHIGIYGYKKQTLIKFSKMSKSKLENFEKLEQLRLLEGGINIKLIYSNTKSIGIDTLEDFEKAKQLIIKNET